MRVNRQKIVLTLLLATLFASTSFSPNLSAMDNNSGVSKGSWPFWSWKTAGVVLGVGAVGYLACRWSGMFDDLLLEAVYRGNLVRVKVLVSLGADVNAEGIFGWTPLHCAADSGHFEIVKYLVEHGADVNVKDVFGRTPFYRAVIKGHLEIVKYLVKQKADVNAKDDDGRTPLHWAVIKRHLEIVKYLVLNGADFTTKTNQNRTPRDLARTNHFLAIEKYLTLAEDFYQIVNNTMTVEKFFETHGFTQQVLDDVFGLAIMTGSYETLEKLYVFDSETFPATINGLTKIDFTASPAKSLSWYVQLLGIAIASSSTKLFHKLIAISHAIDGLPSIIYGILLPRVKLDKPSDTELVTQIKELRKAWVTACKEKEKEDFIKNSTRLLKTEFALEQNTYQENTFENKKLIKTEVTPIPNYIAPQVLSFLGTSDFVNKK